jgi:hypothetical protein
MASVKATLTVCLKANDVVVAELEDPGLWQRVLAAINLGDPQYLEPKAARTAADLPIDKNTAGEKAAKESKENGNGNGHAAATAASWPGPKEWSAWTDQVK